MKEQTKRIEGIDVVMGPRNGPKEPHPVTIIAVCALIGAPLPVDAVCKFPPSKYIKKGILTGNLEDIKVLLGDSFPDIDEEELKKKYRAFKRKFKSQQNIKFTRADFTVYFCDWLLYARDRGFTHNCYFDYELYNKEPDIRDTFLNEGYRTRIHKACTTKAYRKIFLDKAKFNRQFSKFIQRDWIDVTSCTQEEFNAFLEKHERFFGKPVRGTGGAGARVIERNSDTPENLYAMCKEETLILEDIISQHEELNKINESTLNTVRINTLLCADNEARIMLTVARFGRAGKCADNFHAGGVGAIVDIETGKIITEAIDRGHCRSPYHPDSHFQILGFQYPEWEKVKQAVCEAARMVPEMRHVGWDIAVTADGNVEFVEGNGRANFDVLQSPDQIGRRHRYAKYLPELEALKGIETVEQPPLTVVIPNQQVRNIQRTIIILKKRIKRKLKKLLKG